MVYWGVCAKNKLNQNLSLITKNGNLTENNDRNIYNLFPQPEIDRFCLLINPFQNSVLQNAIDKALEFLVDFPSWHFKAILSLGDHLLLVERIL